MPNWSSLAEHVSMKLELAGNIGLVGRFMKNELLDNARPCPPSPGHSVYFVLRSRAGKDQPVDSVWQMASKIGFLQIVIQRKS